MIPQRCKAQARSAKNNDWSVEVTGWYCQIEGGHYMVCDDARLLSHGKQPSDVALEIFDLTGLVTVDPDTVELLEAEHGED